MTHSSAPCTGRFAPSPTGELHAGSLIAALGSFVDARAAGGRWLVRIDDLDPPRTQAGASASILHTLEQHGLWWDEQPLYQSTRREAYAEALRQLERDGALYRCTCSRRDLVRAARRGPLGRIYPGTCRAREVAADAVAATRLRMPPGELRIHDHSHGPITLDADRDVGDVVVLRRDRIPAYHLATTLDDAHLGVTAVVRGVDLLPAALVQRAIQQTLALPATEWRHLPLVRTATGVKLSKQTGAHPLDPERPVAQLLDAWAVLGQAPPVDTPETPEAFLRWAVSAWQPQRIPADPQDRPGADRSGPAASATSGGVR